MLVQRVSLNPNYSNKKQTSFKRMTYQEIMERIYSGSIKTTTDNGQTNKIAELVKNTLGSGLAKTIKEAENKKSLEPIREFFERGIKKLRRYLKNNRGEKITKNKEGDVGFTFKRGKTPYSLRLINQPDGSVQVKYSEQPVLSHPPKELLLTASKDSLGKPEITVSTSQTLPADDFTEFLNLFGNRIKVLKRGKENNLRGETFVSTSASKVLQPPKPENKPVRPKPYRR